MAGWGPSIKYVRSKGDGGRRSKQKRTSIVFMASFYCLKEYKGEGCPKITKFERTYFMDGHLSSGSLVLAIKIF